MSFRDDSIRRSGASVRGIQTDGRRGSMRLVQQEGLVPIGSVKKIFEASKSFWRTRTTIDVLIFEHFAKPCEKVNEPIHIIEVVAFDPHTNKEAPHIYIKSKELCDNIRRHEASSTADSDIIPGTKTGQDAMAKYIFSRVGVVATGSKAAIPCVSSVSPNAHESFHEMTKHLPPQLSLSPSGKKAIGADNNNNNNKLPEVHSPRAPPELEDPVLVATAAVMEKYGFQSAPQADSAGNSSGDGEETFQIELLKMGKDDASDVVCVCETMPSGLCPLPDLKRLKFTKSISSEDEFNRKVAFIRASSMMIDKNLLEASKLSDSAVACVHSFNDMYKMLRERSVYHADWSTAKRRWKKAINVIMLRIGVAKTTTRLGEIAARHKFRTPPISSSNPSSGSGSAATSPRGSKSSHTSGNGSGSGNASGSGSGNVSGSGHGVSGGLAVNEHLPQLIPGNKNPVNSAKAGAAGVAVAAGRGSMESVSEKPFTKKEKGATAKGAKGGGGHTELTAISQH